MIAFVGVLAATTKWPHLQHDHRQLTLSRPSSIFRANDRQRLRTNTLPSTSRRTAYCTLHAHAQPTSTSTSVSVSTSSTPSKKPAVIFVLGGPGSGKGTQCELLKREFHLPQLCAGELLRREAKTGSELGKSISSIMQRGEIVPGHVTMSLLRRELDLLSSSTEAVLIDGFPRAMDQAQQFELEASPCTFVLFFKCEPEVMVQRLRRRAMTSQRRDDVEGVFKSRLHTFQCTTMPVVEHYKQRGLLKEIDAENGNPQQVFERTKPLFTDLFRKLNNRSL